MSGKFLKRGAIIGTLKGQERINALQKRRGTRHPVRTVPCGCPDEGCGAFHAVVEGRVLPTAEEAVATLKAGKAARRAAAVRAKP